MAAVQGGDDVLTPSKKSTEACRKDLESINNQNPSLSVQLKGLGSQKSIKLDEEMIGVCFDTYFSATPVTIFLRSYLLAEMDNDLEKLEADISKLIKSSDIQTVD
ncbi:hypothetical protein Smp_153630 [Schistosoma mansoni]|uniref:hypothetical protein n=1 Tax=Schistosoma mansoni TaxID=6183 RepID=UPI0001A63C5F|nr:hypothetical protein Smp_153630 [Schistosoma mansoni]|eukprot:XP_018645872.1 hypothetical protein Smp_153630 [Schistosoma mansoni]